MKGKSSELLKQDILRIYNHNNITIKGNDMKGWRLWYHALRLFKNDLNGFRSIFYYRFPKLPLLNFFFKPHYDVIIWCKEVEGGGFVFHHPFATVINADHIGYGCTIRNNTTIGNKLYDGIPGRPYIKNNVDIGVNAVLLGKITIGNNVTIGGGAIVTKDVPDDCVVVGNPAHIIREAGEKCYKKL